MKTKKAVFYILMFLPLLAVIAALQFLPDQIPAHFDINGNADRWGSKYETLVFPVSTVIFGAIMLITAKLSSKAEDGGKGNNEKICILTGIFALAIFNAMTVYFLYADFISAENLSAISVDINSVIFAVIGIAMIVLGNSMPKLRKNHLIGLRTNKSMDNEDIWKKSQRFAGLCLIIGGIGVVAASIFTNSLICLLISLGIILSVTAVSVIYTFL